MKTFVVPAIIAKSQIELDEMFMLLLNCRQAEFFGYKPAIRAMPKSKIIVILALFEPDEYVLVFALLA